MQLVGDIGGTQARFALAEGGVIRPGSQLVLAGADFAGLDDALLHYLEAQGRPRVAAVCLAVAGPVTRGQARLTNRDWSMTESGLRMLTGAGRAWLVNDMLALGAGAEGARLTRLRAGQASGGQSLVVNAGTGFNICPVLRAGGGLACLEAEAGHAALPAPVAAELAAVLGARAGAFRTNEDLFSGQGIARLWQAMHGTPGPEPAEIARAGTPQARALMDLATRLFGRLLRELALQHMPRAGIYLAGSAAAALAAHDREALLAAFLSVPEFAAIPEAMPLAVIADGAAALQGCANLLQARKDW